jgi:hypothetical protein
MRLSQPQIGAGLLPRLTTVVAKKCNGNMQSGNWRSLGYRLEKRSDESYHARFNVAVYQYDGVTLEKIAEFLEKRTSQKNLTARLV